MKITSRLAFKSTIISLAVATLLLSGQAPGSLLTPNAYADPIWDQWVAADAAVAAGTPELAVPHWQFLVDHYVSIEDWESAALFCGKLDEYFDSVKNYDEAIRYYELENK